MKKLGIIALLLSALAGSAAAQQSCTTYCVLWDLNTGQCIQWQTDCY